MAPRAASTDAATCSTGEISSSDIPSAHASIIFAAPCLISCNGPRLGGEKPIRKSAISVAISMTAGRINVFAPNNNPVAIDAITNPARRAISIGFNALAIGSMTRALSIVPSGANPRAAVVTMNESASPTKRIPATIKISCPCNASAIGANNPNPSIMNSQAKRSGPNMALLISKNTGISTLRMGATTADKIVSAT